MLHSENIRRADQTYEIRHDNNGNAIHVFIKDGTAIVFSSATDLFDYIQGGEPSIDRFYVNESDLDALYDSFLYEYHDLKNEWCRNHPDSDPFKEAHMTPEERGDLKTKRKKS